MITHSIVCLDNPLILGTRYWKDSDLAVILIYDPAGYIAGIQAGVWDIFQMISVVHLYNLFT